jgi:glycosyltransferase involved in cell wall biosynthesis
VSPPTAPVALIVPCHNYGRYAGEALRSIAAQEVRPAEVVVVDDGSSDDSASTLLALQDELDGVLDMRVLLRRHEGLPRTVLAGLHETSSPLFAVVSADDRVLPGFVGRLADALQARPDAAFAYPKIRLFGDESGVYQTYPFDVDRLLFDQNYVPGGSLMRRTAYEEVGGLRGLVAYEDWDLFLSFAEHRWSGVLVPEVLAEWRRHSLARNHVSMRTRLLLRSQVLAGHPRLLARRAHMAVPWTAYAVGRRVAARVRPGSGASRRTRSAWVEQGS